MKIKKILISILFLLLVVIGFFYYKNKLAPTKVAIINYPDFMTTKMIKSNTNKWIKIKSFKPNDLPNFNNYSQIIIFGMGINLPIEQENKIKEAGEKGINIFIQALTTPRLDYLSNMHGKTYDQLTDYMNNGGTENFKNMFNYIRRNIDKKNAFTDSIIPPKEIPSDVIFYKDENAIFEKITDYETYAKQQNLFTKNAPKIAIFTSMPGPFNANREHLNSLITELEKRHLNVYPIASFSNRTNYMHDINPDLIIYLPHGKFGRDKDLIDQLKKQNVPILCPITVFEKHNKWLTDKQGLIGGILSQSVTMPEIDGGILPYAVFAQYEDENGYLLFQAIPERLKKFGQIAQNYINLKKKKNQNKKIAIIYFKGPGKNALVASNMEVLPSLHNTLLRMKKEGYNLGNLPNNYADFEKKIYEQGPILGTYAKGAFDHFLQHGNPELIPVEKYNTWCKQTLPKKLIENVELHYGKAPGTYMSLSKKGKDYIAIARVQYGNITLLPQPLPAVGDNEFKLIHGAKIAPPHTYIAPYLWIQNSFKADACIHFGTHGSLEFLPGKQIALSDYDWTDPLIGTTPHFYIYTISNVGEGMIAKRRSYTTTQTYLTPPFIEAQALGQQEILHQKIHKYEQMKGAIKKEYALSIKKMAVEQGINKDIGLDSILTQPYNDEQMITLANYLEEIDHEKITGGLYTMGIPYTQEKLNETVIMMIINSLAYNWAEIDIQKEKYSRKKIENKTFFNTKYTHPAERQIKAIIKGKSASKTFDEMITKTDLKRAENWQKKQQNMLEINQQMFNNTNNEKNDTIATEQEKKQLKTLIIKIMPQPEKIKYIKRIESDKEYEQIISLLDPKIRAKAKRISKMIPAMAKALKISEDKTVNQIVILIQKKELRQLTLNYINDNNLKTDVERERRHQDSLLIVKAIEPTYFSIIKNSKTNIKLIKYQDIDTLRKQLNFFIEKKDKLKTILNKENKQKQLANFLENDFENYRKLIEKQITKLETQEMLFAQAIFQVKKDLNSITQKLQELSESPEQELITILNSLNGGYTAPSSGGDPVSNPNTVPTGRNLYAIDAEKTPSQEAWKIAQKLGNSLLANFKKKHGKYPQKVSFTLWSSSFIETEGTTIGQILYLLGVEPIWDNFGRIKDVRIIPLTDLGRPRIDIIVQTSGQLRDLAASRLFLINKAIAKVAAEDENTKENFIIQGVADAETALIKKGLSPKKARELAKKRVFGGINGNYGTGIMGMVENSDRWDSTKIIAQQYINNMGAIYGNQEEWGQFEKGVFEAALLNTEAVVQPRQSNTWGALSLDHVYEFMGGLNLAIHEVTGNDPEAYFNDFRNSSNPKIQTLKEAIWIETRTTLINPRYIKELTKGGASSAETFAETFRNTFGWNVMKPSIIEDRLWNKLYNVYIKDTLNLNLHQFFQRENPYALQEMTAVMIETIRKKMWKASPEQIKTITTLHAQLIKNYEAACSGFVCDNTKLKNFISKQLPNELKKTYEQEINKIREAPKHDGKDAIILKKEEQNKTFNKTNKTSFLQNKIILIATLIVFILISITIIFLRKKRK